MPTSDNQISHYTPRSHTSDFLLASVYVGLNKFKTEPMDWSCTDERSHRTGLILDQDSCVLKVDASGHVISFNLLFRFRHHLLSGHNLFTSGSTVSLVFQSSLCFSVCPFPIRMCRNLFTQNNLNVQQPSSCSWCHIISLTHVFRESLELICDENPRFQLKASRATRSGAWMTLASVICWHCVMQLLSPWRISPEHYAES